MTIINTPLVLLAQQCGATYYTPGPMRAIRGMAFTFDQLDALAERLRAEAGQHAGPAPQAPAAPAKHSPGTVHIAVSALEQERARGYRQGLAAATRRAPLAAVPQAPASVLTEIVGCIDAANAEGLDDALVNNTDARLTDLVQRRLLPAFYAAIAAQAHGVPAHADVAAPAVDAPAKGEVLVEVHGLTGSGKSALCGEIEIMCRALGLAVTWVDGKSEKNLTGADWTEALELYKPRVRIVERNHAAQAKEGGAA